MLPIFTVAVTLEGLGVLIWEGMIFFSEKLTVEMIVQLIALCIIHSVL